MGLRLDSRNLNHLRHSPDPHNLPAGWRHRVRAAQALAAIADPVALSMDVPAADLREELLRGGRALLGTAQTARCPGLPYKILILYGEAA